MIGYLKGVLAAKHPPQLVVDIHGVGYEVEAPMSTFYDLPALGEEVKLLTHLVVREDAHMLYGFGTEAERQLFRSLIKVSGVGAKMAVGILSGISVEGFTRCVQTEDSASLVKVPGIGKKTAERLIVEMRDRLGEGPVSLPGVVAAVEAGEPDAAAEAHGALLALGYKPAQAVRMLAGIDCRGLATEEIIRQVLQNVAQS